MSKTVIWDYWYKVELLDSPRLPSQEYLSDISGRISSWVEIDCIGILKIRARISWSLCTLFGVEYVDLLDLRGIDLSWRTIGNYDLSYCCLDGANFENSKLDCTGFQFSYWQQVNFTRARLVNLQVSPIILVNPLFLASTVDGWRFDESIITNACTEWLVIKNSEWLRLILEK